MRPMSRNIRASSFETPAMRAPRDEGIAPPAPKTCPNWPESGRIGRNGGRIVSEAGFRRLLAISQRGPAGTRRRERSPGLPA